jgi:hypothetical protein
MFRLLECNADRIARRRGKVEGKMRGRPRGFLFGLPANAGIQQSVARAASTGLDSAFTEMTEIADFR